MHTQGGIVAAQGQDAVHPDSLNGRAERVRAAWSARGEDGWPEVFEDHLIVQRELAYSRVPYTIDGDAITFGEPTPVTLQYIPVNEAQLEVREPTGKAWLVRIIKAGPSAQPKPVPPAGILTPIPWIYTAEAIKSAPEVFEGAPVYAFEVAPNTHGHLPLTPDEKGRKGLVRHLVGYLEEVRESTGDLLARFNPIAGAEWLKDKLLDLYRRGRADLLGLSIDARVYGTPVATAEGHCFAVLQFAKPATVDVATHPAAGGAFLRALEAHQTEEGRMVKALLAKLRAARPDLAAALGDNPTEAQVQEAFDKALTVQSTGDPLAEVRAIECRMLLRDRLSEAKLPKPVEAKLRKRFEGQVFESTAIEAAITDEKEVLDALAQEGRVHGAGQTKAEVLVEQTEKVQLGMDRMFGADSKESATIPAKDIPAFRSFSEAFAVITGRNLQEMMAHPIADAKEAILASTWANVLGTSMHRRLLKDYAAVDYKESAISRPRPGGVSNFKTQEALRVKYFGDLSEFDPELADYPEIAEPGDEKVTYALVQKGNILTVSRRTLINDDLGAVARMVGRLGRAARRTHAKFIWNFFINNSVYDVDSVAWFHATHSNLGSTALTANDAGVTEVLARLQAMGKQTEPGSGERLGIDFSEPIWIAVPIDLMGVALALNTSPQVSDASNNLVANRIYQRFGANNERIIVNPLMTDATDWGLFRDPDVIDSIEVGYLNDQRDPEFLIANIPTVGQMFVADKQQFKVRHEYGADIADFRGAQKNVVA